LYIGSKFDGHDSAIFIVDHAREQLYGLSSERLSRRKHDDIFPIAALERLLAYAALDPFTISDVRFANAYSSDRDALYPIDKLETEMERRGAPAHWRSADPSTGKDTLGSSSAAPTAENTTTPALETLHDCITRHLRRIFPVARLSVRHHDHEYCHALSSYFFSPMQTALVVTMDGIGDDGIFSRAFIARHGVLKSFGASRSTERLRDPLDQQALFSKPCTLGGIYSYFTHKLGFLANCDEGKVEALAAFGTGIEDIGARLAGAVQLDKRAHSVRIDAHAVREALADPRLNFADSLAEKADLAATVQGFIECVVLDYLEHLVDATGMSEICLSGGVFANVVLNMKIAERISDRLFITPAVGDDGSAQGAAVAELLCDGHAPEQVEWLRRAGMPYFGTSYPREDVLAALDTRQGEIHFEDRWLSWPEEAAERIHAGEVGAIFQGRMEWGPRALGNRSILLSPFDPHAKDILNQRVKRRPPFQPVCPAALQAEMHRLFERVYPNKHMTCAFPMKPEHHDRLPSAIHIDGTARPQFVEETDNPGLFRLLTRLKALSDYGVVLNTSFNMHGRTMVESPTHALDDFIDTGLDFMVIEGYLVTRREEAAGHVTPAEMRV
jgi:carbamoyltransferase